MAQAQDAEFKKLDSDNDGFITEEDVKKSGASP